MKIYVKILILGIITSTLIISACKKTEDTPSLFPFSYRYNSPNLAQKDVFAIDTSGNVKKITDTLGSFNRSNQDIAEGINKIIQNKFSFSMITEISFSSGEDATLEFGRFDTMLQRIILLDTINTKYSLNGNSINLVNFPSYSLEINNSFLELNLCNEFTYHIKVIPRPMNTDSIAGIYTQRLCRFIDPRDVAGRVKFDFPGEIIDTISVEKVNYIFSRY